MTTREDRVRPGACNSGLSPFLKVGDTVTNLNPRLGLRAAIVSKICHGQFVKTITAPDEDGIRWRSYTDAKDLRKIGESRPSRQELEPPKKEVSYLVNGSHSGSVSVRSDCDMRMLAFELAALALHSERKDKIKVSLCWGKETEAVFWVDPEALLA